MKRIHDSIHYKFKDTQLLEIALSHPSISKHALENQRFEFLGDSLLSWCVSDYLFQHFTEVDEGQLNLMKVSIVSGKSLTQKAIQLKLDSYLKMSDSYANNFGEPTDSMLENCFEALVAAIFLDSDYKQAKEWIINTFSEELLKVSEAAKLQNPKGRLQEWAQSQQLGTLPRYELVKSDGPEHGKLHTVKVYLSNDVFGIGTDSSIKGAEMNAAKDALSKINA